MLETGLDTWWLIVGMELSNTDHHFLHFMINALAGFKLFNRWPWVWCCVRIKNVCYQATSTRRAGHQKYKWFPSVRRSSSALAATSTQHLAPSTQHQVRGGLLHLLQHQILSCRFNFSTLIGTWGTSRVSIIDTWISSWIWISWICARWSSSSYYSTRS